MIRFGLIGAGPNGVGNAANFLATGMASFRAVADPNQEAARSLLARLDAKEAKVCRDFHEFLPLVDVVVISSPNFLHVEQAVECAGAGKHIWIEKPMALDCAGADAICAAVDKSGVKSFVGFSTRFGAVPSRMKEIVHSGQLGPVRSIWSRRLCNLKIPDGHWRREYAKSGGVMSELMAHEIDWMISIAGMPETIYCRKQADLADDVRANDHLWVTFGFPGGATGTIECSQNSQISDFSKGIVGSIGSTHDRAWGSEIYRMDQNGEEHRLEKGAAFDRHAHFLDVVAGRAESEADVHHGRKIVLISELALQSAVRGCAVKVDSSPDGNDAVPAGTAPDSPNVTCAGQSLPQPPTSPVSPAERLPNQ